MRWGFCQSHRLRFRFNHVPACCSVYWPRPRPMGDPCGPRVFGPGLAQVCPRLEGHAASLHRGPRCQGPMGPFGPLSTLGPLDRLGPMAIFVVFSKPASVAILKLTFVILRLAFVVMSHLTIQIQNNIKTTCKTALKIHIQIHIKSNIQSHIQTHIQIHIQIHIP